MHVGLPLNCPDCLGHALASTDVTSSAKRRRLSVKVRLRSLFHIHDGSDSFSNFTLHARCDGGRLLRSDPVGSPGTRCRKSVWSSPRIERCAERWVCMCIRASAW